MRPVRGQFAGSGQRGTGTERKARAERGAGTVLVIAVVALAGLLITVVLAVGRAVQVRHRAQGAADLAALAAAAVVEEGTATGATVDGCAAAEVVAAANRASLTGCEPHADGDVTVAVEVDLGGFVPIGLGSSVGRARAGPLDGSS